VSSYWRAIIPIAMVLLLCTQPVGARNYAVLISAGQTTADDAYVNSEYWYDMLLTYKTLIDEGYGHDDIYVLYGFGQDYVSSRPCYQNPYPDPITDYSNSRANIISVFANLDNIMTDDDFLFVWWMGHGGQSGPNQVVFWIENYNDYVYDYQFASYVNQIQNYDRRAFSFMTCNSGGILDDLDGPDSIVMTSSTLYESSASDWLCDTVHAEFNYFEAAAFHWTTPCGLCGAVNADTTQDQRICFNEAFQYALARVAYSTPQMSDVGGLCNSTFLFSGCPGDLNGDGIRNVTDFTLFAAAYDSQIGDPDYNASADLNGDGFVNVSDFTLFASSYYQPCP
jgi:hypothetical protein